MAGLAQASQEPARVNALIPTEWSSLLVVLTIGTVAFALSGVMAAREAGMDWLGGLVLAVVTAVGGGTLRDVLIAELPVFWVADEWPIVVSLGTAIVAIALLRIKPSIDPRGSTWYLASDAIGLGAFVVVGSAVALDAGTSWFVAVLMGVVTGVGGGVVRDVFARRTPIVFVGEIYAVAGLLGAAAHVVLHEANAGEVAELWLPLAVVVTVRAAAVRFSLRLPRLGA